MFSFFLFKSGSSHGLNVYLAGVTQHDGSQRFLCSQISDSDQLTWFTMLAIDEQLRGIQAIVTIKKVGLVYRNTHGLKVYLVV